MDYSEKKTLKFQFVNTLTWQSLCDLQFKIYNQINANKNIRVGIN